MCRALLLSPGGVVLLDAGGRVVGVNPAGGLVLGVVEGDTLASAFLEPHRTGIASLLEDARRAGAGVAGPVRAVRTDGSTHLELTARYDGAGEGCSAAAGWSFVVSVSVVPTEASDRVFRANQQRLAAHFERTPLASIEWNLDRTARLWNPAAEKIFGFTAEEAATNDLFPLIVHPESRGQVDDVWEKLSAGTGGEANTNTNMTKDGRTVLCRWYNTPLRDEDGRVLGVASLAEDITERALAERRLRESERRLSSIIDSLPVLVWALDEDLRPVFWNAHAQMLTGYEGHEVLGVREAASLIFPADKRSLAKFVSGDFDMLERPLHCSDGSTRRVLWSNVATRCPVPGWRAWGVGIDVTEQRLAERALRESERRFRDVFATVSLAGVVLSPDGTVLDCNDAMLRTLERGREEVIGRDWYALTVPEEDRDAARRELERAMTRGEFVVHRERRLVSASGASRSMNWARSLLRDPDGRPIAACAFGQDVTEQRRAEAELADYREHLEKLVEQRTRALAESHGQLARAERQAAVGQLAAGLGHDINNVLLPVRCHLDTIVGVGDERARSAVEAIGSGLQVLERLADSLRSLTDTRAVRGTVGAESIDLRAWWAEVGALVRRVPSDGVAFEAKIGEDLPRVRGEHHRLTQAVVNLVLNSVEALDRASSPRVGLRVAAVAGGAVIEVSDNGRGMSAEIRERALEPFYSTKTRTLSTGLGLSIVNGFVRGLGGQVEIESDPGSGTCVRLILPEAAGVAAEAVERVEVALVEAAVDVGVAVLDVSDQRVRSIHEQVLQALGWEVLPYTGDIDGVDVLVTDREGGRGNAGGDQNPRRLVVLRVVSDSDSAEFEGVSGVVSARAGLLELRRLYGSVLGRSQPG
jgi:PAS domain S-box-containing protein